ncbi:MAG: aspartate/glutamate racemase family protein [Alphaproteobacteria bacterium]|nr:aspartate/glutamate racemase family protein [Alphaproteobacteria bacterium]
MRSNKQQGGKAVFGAAVGILMLEARFPRIPGDMGNARTWPFPVLYKVVRGASPDLVVRNNAEGLLDDFIAAARDLVADGADGITTNCGFLSHFQKDLSRAVDVPVATSSLMQVPAVQALLPPGKRVGVITVSKSTLTPEHLTAAGAPADAPVVGTEGGRELTRVLLNDEPELDVELARLDMLDAAGELVQANPDVGAIVLECTNMTPYAADLRRATGLPVFTIVTFVRWFESALMPDPFAPDVWDPRA